MPRITLQATQIEIAYLDAGAGPVVLLLHAFPLDSSMWREQVSDLDDHHRIIAPDFPGFGSSGVSGGLSIEGAADLMGEFLDHLGINERVVVAGLSMGGYVALAFARLLPQRLRALILADTKAEPDDDAAKAGREKMIQLATNEGSGAVIDQLLPKLLGPSSTSNRPDVVRTVRKLATRQKPEGVVAALKALRDRPDASEGLPHVSVPTLVLVGDQDAITPLANAKTLADKIPNAKLATVAGAGHLSNLENPAMFTAVVREFLAGLPAEQGPSRTV
jgi:pimeloyl-ACP methyl ester carboxylesterase